MRFPRLAGLLALACLLSAPLASASDAPTVQLSHFQGTTTIPLHPQRVVILNPVTLDSADALGIDPLGVPRTAISYPAHLARYNSDEYLNAGTLFEPDYEALSHARPDLILAGGRALAAYNKLSDIAPTVSLDIDPNDVLNSLRQRTTQLGEIMGKQAQASTVLARFDAQVADLRRQAAQAGTAMMLMVNGGKLSAYTPHSRFGFIFDVLQFRPAIALPTASKHGNAISPELIMQANPDWLFVLDRDSAIGSKAGVSARQVLDNPLVRRTTAWKKQQIIWLDSASLYLAGGIQSYSLMMEQIRQALSTAGVRPE
ncbi:MAG: Petrobactin-binding protein YclQ [Pantoea stewartii]|uniref:siderophore ABC transporter substrate-binding protein n=1 Tax=Pantoea stewartii TaxID=66269 RepID=UPI0024BE2DD4|nr:siderophore ABC transporter substrate-binding protein [Pantoea stewartii]WHS99742.1 MAG: Petrobactin-binding protein YclQ [Pantoea stewartii]